MKTGSVKNVINCVKKVKRVKSLGREVKGTAYYPLF